MNDPTCIHCTHPLSQHVLKGGSHAVWCPDRDEFFEGMPVSCTHCGKRIEDHAWELPPLLITDGPDAGLSGVQCADGSGRVYESERPGSHLAK